jgi:uncharacterized protein (TIGR03437 family)
MKFLAIALFLVAAVATAQPTISNGGVLNSASYMPPSQAGGGIAAGSLFVVYGSGMGPATLAQAAYPLPTTLAGTSVTVAVIGAAPVTCPLVYTSTTQLAAIMPSRLVPPSTTPIEGTITVIFKGRRSSTAPIHILPGAFGIYTMNQAGSGAAILQSFDPQTGLVNTLVGPARPGQIVVLWGTGLGPVQGNEAAGPLPGALSPDLILYVGGVAVRPDYVGRSGCCAGVDQIIFRVPAGVEGCHVPLTVMLNGIVSNVATMPIASEALICTSR